jgi:hypothetical protein
VGAAVLLTWDVATGADEVVRENPGRDPEVCVAVRAFRTPLTLGLALGRLLLLALIQVYRFDSMLGRMICNMGSHKPRAPNSRY